MNEEKKNFRIGELAQAVGVEKFIIRFWEKEFNIKSNRSEGGQRFYTARHLNEFQKIKTLLYEEKFTISGARKYLHKDKNITGAKKNICNSCSVDEKKEHTILNHIKKSLMILREMI
jgi:DNA-binding transcriptional MerR regulator